MARGADATTVGSRCPSGCNKGGVRLRPGSSPGNIGWNRWKVDYVEDRMIIIKPALAPTLGALVGLYKLRWLFGGRPLGTRLHAREMDFYYGI